MNASHPDSDIAGHPSAKHRLLTAATFELIPMKSTLEKARILPAGTRVSVTASPTKDMAATIDLAEQLARQGLEVVPHISARLTKTRAELVEIVERLRAIGTREIFVVGGDGGEFGDFGDAIALIETLSSIEHPFERIGVTGYPEGHPTIPDDVLMRALIDKAPFASSITTQMCFDPEAIEGWVRMIRERGISLPVVVGIPGVTDITKLMAVSARIGVGTSLRFLAKHRGLATRLLRPYSPDGLVDSIAERAGDGSLGIAGLHVYTFNQVDSTLEWYRKALS